MTFQQFCYIAATILAGVGFIPYILAILRGETKPERATWIIWFLLNTLVAGGMLQKHALNGQMVLYVIGDFVVILFAIKYGRGGWSPLDKWCLIGAAVGLLLWYMTNDPLYAIVIGLGIDVIGFVPTVVKTWRHPDQEDRLAWTLALATSLLQSWAIPIWTVEDAAPPITYLIIQFTALFLIIYRPRRFFART
jgi:hypothetical protein